MKKRSLIVLITMLVISIMPLFGFSQVNASSAQMKVGNYLSFGEYKGQPILWRIIDFDSSGNPLILTDKVIDQRAFDVAGPHNNGLAVDLANADWEASNLRAWLNSSSEVMKDDEFPCGVSPYTAKTMHDPSGYIAGEGGFLCDNNFTSFEKMLVLPVTQKVTVTKYYKGSIAGGSSYMMSPTDVQGSTYEQKLKDYQNIYYANVTDKVFLLNIDQFMQLHDNLGKEGTFTSPTEQCISHIASNFSPLKFNCNYWMLRDAMLWQSENRWILNIVGLTENDYNEMGGSDVDFPPNVGVRPAMYLDASLISVSSGSGTATNPYVLGVPTQTAKVTSSKVVVDNESKAFLAYNIGGNNYFKLRDLAYVINGSTKNFEVTYDNDKKAINLISNKAYTTIGGEMSSADISGSKIASLSTSSIFKDGQLVSLKAYNIGGNNYFKLRDIAKAFDIGVSWDNKEHTIRIDTAASYIE